ncbi:hypothetical protein Hanom_Chr00s000716g01655641 [Helianthus anomalus]
MVMDGAYHVRTSNALDDMVMDGAYHEPWGLHSFVSIMLAVGWRELIYTAAGNNGLKVK